MARTPHYNCLMIIVTIFICLLILIGVITVLLKFVFLNPTVSNNSITTTTTGTIACALTCQSYQTCINHTCISDGDLVISLTWSRIGDADLKVETPSKNIISRNNKGPDNSTDYGQFAVEISDGTGPEEVFWSKNTTPPSGNYYVCAEPYYFSPAVSINNPVTFTVQVRIPPSKIKVYTMEMTNSGNSGFLCSNVFNTFVTFHYP